MSGNPLVGLSDDLPTSLELAVDDSDADEAEDNAWVDV